MKPRASQAACTAATEVARTPQMVTSWCPSIEPQASIHSGMAVKARRKPSAFANRPIRLDLEKAA